MIQLLVTRGYDSDPVRAWRKSQDRLKAIEAGDELEEVNEDEDFNYILGMPIWNLTKEKKDALIADRDSKAEELRLLRYKTPADLWRSDLDNFVKQLDEAEEQERLDAVLLPKEQGKLFGRAGKGPNKKAVSEILPSKYGSLVEPFVDDSLRQRAHEAVARKQKAAVKRVEKRTKEEEESEEEDAQLNKSLSERLGIKSSPLGTSDDVGEANKDNPITKKDKSVAKKDKPVAKKNGSMKKKDPLQPLITSVANQKRKASKVVNKQGPPAKKTFAGLDSSSDDSLPPRARSKIAISDSDSSSSAGPVRVKKVTNAKPSKGRPAAASKKIDFSDDESDFRIDSDSPEVNVAPRATTGRARKAVTYNVDISSDDSF